MNNWLLLFVLISFIVYIPSFNASGSYSSSSPGGRRRSGRGGQTGSVYGGSNGKGRPTESTGFKSTAVDDTRKGSKGGAAGGSGSGGSDAKLDTDYRDIIEYISKEIDNGKGSDYSRSGASYSRRRDDDIGAPRDGGSDTSYPRGRNDDYRNGADGGYPAYIPPSYIPYPVPGYSSGGGNKGALSSGLLLQLTDSIQEQYGSIAALQHKAEQCKEDLAELKEDTRANIETIKTDINNLQMDLQGLSAMLHALIKDLQSPRIQPSCEIIRAICVGPFGARGVSGDNTDPSTYNSLTCSSGSTRINPLMDDLNDIGPDLTLTDDFTLRDVEDCETLCRETTGCVAFNWIINDNGGGPGFSCEVYSSDEPTFAALATDGDFDPEAIVFCILDDIPCIKGAVVEYAGPLENLPDYLLPADGQVVNNNHLPGICGILGEIYGDGGDHDDDTCELPDFNGKTLRYGKTDDCADLLEEQPACITD